MPNVDKYEQGDMSTCETSRILHLNDTNQLCLLFYA